MDRRRFLLTLLAGVLAERVGAEAEQAGKIHQIGYLAVRSASDSFPFRDALRHGLSELGWVERRNIVIEYRFAEGRYDRMHNLATELVLLKVDVMVAEGTAAATAAKSATRSIPIVATSVSDPVGIGLIASLARPSGNVTGLSYSVGNETVVKTLELLRGIVPNVRRVAILSNPAHPTQPGTIENLNVAARSLRLQLQLLERPRAQRLLTERSRRWLKRAQRQC